jgi:uncharacterized protein involved in exopolysaccharide biosynthesis
MPIAEYISTPAESVAQTVEAVAKPAELVADTAEPANWVVNAALLWERRRTLARVAAIALVLGATLALLLPKQYESQARMMPPDQTGSGVAMLAALAGRSVPGLGALGGLAGSLLGGRSSGALFVDLLHSRNVSDHLIDRFHLQQVYKKRYRIDTEKYLARRTEIVEDKKSGAISLTFTDTDPRRAQAIAQAYLEELNTLVTTANTSSARREKEFIEQRLVSVQADLQNAEKALGEFSSVNTTLDIKEQTHATVDAAAKLEAERIVAQSELDSLEQIYGEDNVRVRAARARIAGLQHELVRMTGSSTAPLNENSDPGSSAASSKDDLYPSIRQLPRLAVPYTDLYRRVRIQETVFELLSQQYEMARIEEAKDTPVVSVIDAPLVAEKKSSPKRLLIILIGTALSVALACVLILTRHRYDQIAAGDPRKILFRQIAASFGRQINRLPLRGGAR